MTKLERLRYRILHWLFGGHMQGKHRVRDVEHCDLCNEHPEQLGKDEGC